MRYLYFTLLLLGAGLFSSCIDSDDDLFGEKLEVTVGNIEKNIRVNIGDVLQLNPTISPDDREYDCFWGVANRNNTYSVIDGQQRITTVSLLLIAMVNAKKEGLIETTDTKIVEKIFKRYLVDEYQEDERKVKLKPIKKDDPDNPFGSLIKDADQGGQYWYDPKTGKRVSANDPNAKLGLINKRSDEGDWSDWKDAVPSQFLSKQSVSMAKKQLKIAQDNKQEEYDEYCSLNNPTVKKYLLKKFADECDSAAVHLQAAALPGQKYHVIIPNNTLKENEVYAPGYDSGTKLALVRYPHGGTFEIPICTVNNKNALGKKQIGTDPIDAICINSKVAERLSGADFDGDTVMCIPTHDSKGRVKITSTPPLKGLEGFDPKTAYGPDTYEKGKITLMTKANTQKQMGVISNLITDMTLAGASQEDLAAAVRHSMVVIDAEKHKLNFKQSEIDNNIAALHKKYQGKNGNQDQLFHTFPLLTKCAKILSE